MGQQTLSSADSCMVSSVVLIATSGVSIAYLNSGNQTILFFDQRIDGAGAAADRR